ncbi:hypothetical protein HDU91_002085 [Kappamyces sp. JEL0680]|nr:hypothetical protein HDU91_002085 [Kappamyces sp. JEL0680]
MLRLDQESEFWFDTQVLLVGLLINIVNTSAEKSRALAKMEASFDCRPECRSKCKCAGKRNALSVLAAIFDDILSNSKQRSDTGMNVRCAYLAVLIGHIVKHDPKLYEKMKSHLCSGSYDEIVVVLKEFLDFHDAVHSQSTLAADPDRGRNYTKNSLEHLIKVLH